jgi:hypothetical protein
LPIYCAAGNVLSKLKDDMFTDKIILSENTLSICAGMLSVTTLELLETTNSMQALKEPTKDSPT